MLSLTFSLLSIALSADPWGRPEHLRVIAAPPSSYADLNAQKVRYRLWWDIVSGESCEVQAQLRRGWRTIATGATAGWTTRPLPWGTPFRVRCRDDAQARWSEPTTAVPWSSPTDLARLTGPDGAVLAGGVGQIAVDGDTAWASLLGGGLAAATVSSAEVHAYTRWNGLPDDRVIAVDARDGQVLVGTSAGAALLNDGIVHRIWDDGLPDPQVQAVLLGEESVWLGTYRGLVRDSAAGMDELLEPWSVFSLSLDPGGDVWVGYEGFRRFDPVGTPLYPPQNPPPPTHSEDSEDSEDSGSVSDSDADHEARLIQDLLRVKVFDAELAGASRWLATENFGLLLYTDDDINHVDGYPTDSVYGVTVNAQGVWAAGDRAGLIGPAGIRLGRADGLPSGTVWSLAGVGSGLWVGTDQGMSWLMLSPEGDIRTVRPQRHSRWPADQAAADLLPMEDGAFVAGDTGVWLVGEPQTDAADLAAAVNGEVIALLSLGETTWAVGDALVGLGPRGDLTRVALPAPAVAAVVWEGTIWVADGTRLWRYDPERGRMQWVSALPGVTKLTANQQAMWALSERGTLSRVLLGASRPFTQVSQVLDARPGDDGYVCVGTEDGLFRLFEDSGDAEDVLGNRDSGARIPAVAIDPAGGCWFAADDGTVGRTFLDGQEAYTYLPPKSVGEPRRIVPDGPDAAWILTSRGTWRVRLEKPGAQ